MSKNVSFSKKIQQLNLLKQQANERLYKKTGKRLTVEQIRILDSLILCNYTKTPFISFYEDKIKVQLNANENQYLIDYNLIDFDGNIYVGTYKNSEYSIKHISVSELPNFIKG